MNQIPRSLGIIGYGDFTKVIIEHLSPYVDNIVVSSRSRSEGDAGHGARFATVEEVLAQPIIIPSIPSQFIDQFFADNRELVNPQALVVDVASVKVRPIKALKKQLPDSCQIVGTHPMFGPASIAKNGGKLTGLKCAVCFVRADGAVEGAITQFLGQVLGLKLIYKTPEEHDREMAYVQGLSHFIGHVLDEMKIPDSELSTLAYDDLVDMKNIQGQDSWGLFCSIVDENPYAKDVQDQFVQCYQAVRDRLNKVC